MKKRKTTPVMKWTLAVAAVAVVLGLALVAARKKQNQQETNPLGSLSGAAGQNLPRHLAKDFTLSDFNGRSHTLSQFKGRLIIVHFWAAWCPPCVDETPKIIEFAKQFESKNSLMVVMVSLDPSWEKAHEILPSQGLPSNVVSLLDTEASSSDAWGSFEFPETYVVDGNFQIAAKWVGPQPWGDPGVAKAVRNLLNLN